MPDPSAWMSNPFGSGSTLPVRSTPPQPSTPAGPLASQIAVANVAVTVFNPGDIGVVADVINPPSATEPLYLDFVATALAGSPTSIPLLPGQAYRISGPLATPVTVVAASAGHAFVALRY